MYIFKHRLWRIKLIRSRKLVPKFLIELLLPVQTIRSVSSPFLIFFASPKYPTHAFLPRPVIVFITNLNRSVFEGALNWS